MSVTRASFWSSIYVRQSLIFLIEKNMSNGSNIPTSRDSLELAAEHRCSCVYGRLSPSYLFLMRLMETVHIPLRAVFTRVSVRVGGTFTYKCMLAHMSPELPRRWLGARQNFLYRYDGSCTREEHAGLSHDWSGSKMKRGRSFHRRGQGLIKLVQNAAVRSSSFSKSALWRLRDTRRECRRH